MRLFLVSLRLGSNEHVSISGGATIFESSLCKESLHFQLRDLFFRPSLALIRVLIFIANLTVKDRLFLVYLRLGSNEHVSISGGAT